MIRPLTLASLFLAAALPGDAQEGAKPPAAGQDADSMKKKTALHKEDVTRLRGLKFRKDVTVGVYSKDELVTFLKGEFEKELPREKAEMYQRGYAKFGLIPWNMDVFEAYLDLFSSSVAGFYHPKTKELRLIRAGDGKSAEEEAMKAMGIDMERITLVHELAHAAQDQAYELSTLPIEDETNDDLVLAIKSVIEGDASAVGWKYQFKDAFNVAIGTINQTYKSGMLPGKAGELPAYMRMTLTFPYGYGTDFVVKYLRGVKGELKDLDAVFADLPLSSEQILHPEKYYQERDHPQIVAMPDLGRLLGAPWKETFNNVHGEFSVRLILREFRDDEKLRMPVFERAAAGWDGDRYAVLEAPAEKFSNRHVCGKCALHQAEAGSCPRCGAAMALLETWERPRVMIAWASTWDSEKDAREFFEAYAWALSTKYRKPLPEQAPETLFTLTTPHGEVAMELRGKDVVVLDGADPASAKKTGKILDGLVKTELTKVERVNKFVCPADGTKAAFEGACAKCGKALQFKDEEKPAKKRREYSVPDPR